MKKSFVVSLAVVLVSIGCSSEKETENTITPPAPVAPTAVEAVPAGVAPVAPPPGVDAGQSAATTASAPAGAPLTASAEEVAANPKKYLAPAAPRNYGTDGKPNLAALTEALRDWIALTAEIPNSVGDVNDGRYLRFPQPPAGKQYVINKDARTVELAGK